MFPLPPDSHDKPTRFDLEKEALRASGIREESQIAVYQAKLADLHQTFFRETSPIAAPLVMAESLFNWLWKKKPARYKRHGFFRLNETLDAQLSSTSRAVGNCLGLTLLYNCLLRRMGIAAEAFHLGYAFERGPHVLSCLQTGDSLIDIEHVFPYGFGYKDHLNNPSRTRWGDRALVADVYHTTGTSLFEKGEWTGALINYDAAIDLNPEYEKAHLNKAILLQKMTGR